MINDSWNRIGNFILFVWFLEFLAGVAFMLKGEPLPEKNNIITKIGLYIIGTSLFITLIALFA